MINTANNYRYDAIGNVIHDEKEEIETIEWNVYGKVKTVIRKAGSTKAKLEFLYDGAGNRVMKKVTPTGGDAVLTTYYVRDASGNVMASYETSSSSYNLEYSIYGSSRVGVYRRSSAPVARAAAGPYTANTYDYQPTQREYELSNHLGNVYLVVSGMKYGKDTTADGRADYYMADIRSASDYYAFGANISLRSHSTNDYRYGFNGKEKDSDGLGGGSSTYDYGFRIYNPNLGRFLSIDPLSPKYPMLTPYQFASNTPIWAIDIDGLEAGTTNEGVNTLIIFVEGYGGTDPHDNNTQEANPDYEGLSSFANTSYGKDVKVFVFTSSKVANTKDDVAKTIMNYKAKNPGGKVVLVGHSLGADNLVEMVNDHPEIKVNLLILLDIMDNYQDDNIPDNVENVINYRQIEDIVTGEDIEVDDKTKTNSADVVVPGATHTSIDDALSGRVRGHVEAVSNGGDPKKEVDYANNQQPVQYGEVKDRDKSGTNPLKSIEK